METRWLRTFGDYLHIDHSRIERNGNPDIGVLFDIEVMHNGMGLDTKLCIYHAEQKYDKVSSSYGHQTVYTTSKGLYVPKTTLTWTYTFDCPKGKLEEICRYNGDFSEGGFVFSRGNRTLTLVAPKILQNMCDKAHHIALVVKEDIEKLHGKAQNVAEKDRYFSFLRAFGNIK